MVNSDEINKILNRESKRVNSRFKTEVTSGLNYPDLLSIMEDIKRYWKEQYRPTLTSLSCQAVGGKLLSTDDTSLSISLLVAGMAIHDDIIDKSRTKHLRKTIYGLLQDNDKLRSLENAILVGDILIIKGLFSAMQTFRENIKSKEISRIIEILKWFIFEIYEGEFMEISCRKNLDVPVSYHIEYLWKFTADAEACARIGCILGDGTSKEESMLAEIARRFAFNVHLREELFDALNVEGNFLHRLKFESVPLTILYSANKTKEKYYEIKSIINKTIMTVDDAKKLINYCNETKAFQYIYDEVLKNTQKAMTEIEGLKNTPAKKELEMMIKKSFLDIKDLLFSK